MLQFFVMCVIICEVYYNKENKMSRVCDVCGKGKMDGKTVSHANNKTPRKYNVNLQPTEVNGKKVKVCTKCLKSAKKAD